MEITINLLFIGLNAALFIMSICMIYVIFKGEKKQEKLIHFFREIEADEY